MTTFDAHWVHAMASPQGRLRQVFKPLWCVPPRPLRAALAEVHERDASVRTVAAARRRPDRELTMVARSPQRLTEVFDNFEKRLPRDWVDLMAWGYWVAMGLIPPELPALRHAFAALIEHEPQLHVEPYYPNRDHLVHQIADAALALELYRCAHARGPVHDDADWACLRKVVPELEERHRDEVIQAGLALAGLTHDIGYLRYVGATARERLSSIFGVPAPSPGLEPTDVLRVFSGSLIEQMLAPGRSAKPDGLVVDLYQAAWKKGDHGPLSALVLASVARGLRLEGRSIPVIEGILQVAAAAAFLHELHPTSPRDKDRNRPRVVVEARRRIRDYRWPAMFRIVDDLQCWFRPELRAVAATRDRRDRTEMDLGAPRVELGGGELVIVEGAPRPGKPAPGAEEATGLDYLRKHLAAQGQGALFDALDVQLVRSAPA